MIKKILAAAMLAAFSVGTYADTSSISSTTANMGVLQNSYIRAGVNYNTGTFGSGGGTSPGLLFDSTGTGTFNTSYDYLTPGSPFDGFGVKVDSTNYANNNTGVVSIAKVGLLSDGTDSLTWTGSWTHSGTTWGIENIYSLGTTSQYIDITTRITAGSAATNVYYSKFIDPDARAAAGDSSVTDNVIGYGAIPTTNVAFSEALVSRYALGIYTTNTNVTAGVNGWSTQGDGYNGTTYGANYGRGDDTIGISWHWTGVAAGDILTANYAYIFGPSAFAAADSAVTGGAGGGDTSILTGTLTDVGSATSAASTSSTPPTPTLVSTSDPFNVYGSWSAWSVNSGLPVITAGVMHHEASDDGKVQTIARELTTTVTTPELRTRGYDITVTDTYSDSSTIDRVTGTGTQTENRAVAVTTVTDPGSFVGRIDQAASADTMLSHANRQLAFDGAHLFDTSFNMANGMSGGVNGATIGGTKLLDNGWSIGAGVGSLTTKVQDNGTAGVKTSLVNLHGSKEVTWGTVSLSLTHAANDYTTSRTIGDFANSAEFSGIDTSASLTFVTNTGMVRPVLGYTTGVRKHDAYVEAGSVQSARTVAASSESYNYGTMGLQVGARWFNVEALQYTDGVTSIGVTVDKEVAKDTRILAKANRTDSDLGNSTTFAVGLVKKF